MTSRPDVQLVADHSLLLAIPAFAPAILVVGVVIWVAMKDRRTADEDDQAHSEVPGRADEDGSPC
jgi:hypothetical protein